MEKRRLRRMASSKRSQEHGRSTETHYGPELPKVLNLINQGMWVKSDKDPIYFLGYTPSLRTSGSSGAMGLWLSLWPYGLYVVVGVEDQGP